MQLLVLILKDTQCIDTLIRELAEEGVKGGTVLEGTGMANVLMKYCLLYTSDAADE